MQTRRAFPAKRLTVIGNVTLNADSSIWFGVAARRYRADCLRLREQYSGWHLMYADADRPLTFDAFCHDWPSGSMARGTKSAKAR